MSPITISSREDLDSIKGTEQHSAFMTMLAGSLWTLVKDDESQRWDALENNDLIEKFGFTRKDFSKVKAPALPEYVPLPAPDPKMVGIEFEGVMCSATRDDQNGIIAVVMAYQLQGKAFKPTEFVFVNGSKLTLTAANMQQFLGVWMPFRQSFFEVE
jgi:hypothetical protein